MGGPETCTSRLPSLGLSHGLSTEVLVMPRPLGFALFGLAVASFPAGAQSVDSTRERIYERYWEFTSAIKGGTVIPSWLPDGRSFWYADGAPDSTVIYRVDPSKPTKVALFDVGRVRSAVSAALGKALPYRGLPFASFRFVE